MKKRVLSPEELVKQDRYYFESNMEVMNQEGNYVEMLIPSVRTFRVYRDERGPYIKMSGVKLRSRYIE